MVTFDVTPDILKPWIPPHVELDQYQGRTLVSLIGFRFLDASVLGIPIPLHRDFVEVNLRFYTRRMAPEGWRHGVTFIREMVPVPAVALAARALYNEPYRALPMRSRNESSLATAGRAGSVRYEWRSSGQWQQLEVTTQGASRELASGSEEEFIAVRHWGHGTHRDGSAIEYHVRHPRWRYWKARSHVLNWDVAALFGPRFVAPMGRAPSSVFVADGSAVAVSMFRRLGR